MCESPDPNANGPAGGGFEKTRLTIILDAQSDDPARRQSAHDYLYRRYAPPIRDFLAFKGHRREAEDLTHGFFADRIFGGNLLEQFQPGRAKFRTYLLTALENYVVSVHRARTARKRSPGSPIASLERLREAGGDVRPPPGLDAATPDQAFDYTATTTLLDEALAELEQQHRQTGELAYWRLFEARVLDPIFGDGAPTPLAELCGELGLPDERKAANMLVTVKRRFAKAVRRHIRPFVRSEDEVDEEIARLLHDLPPRRAGPHGAARISLRRGEETDG